MTMAFSDLQTLFKNRLLDGDEEVLRHLADGGRFMRVYEHAYLARQQEILAEQYPAVRVLLGDERFYRMTADYIRIHPPQAHSARWIGDRFSSWVRTDGKSRDQALIADMASFEWAIGLAFDAPDDNVLTVEDLASVAPAAWPTLCFEPHPSLQLLRLHHDVTSFQQSIAREEKPTAPVSPLKHPATWAVWRNPETMVVRYRDLTESETRILTAVVDGVSFTGLCEMLAEDDAENAAKRAAEHMRNWIDAGWISGIFAEGLSWASA